MSKIISDNTKILEQQAEEEDFFEVLEEEPLPPVNEFKRFVRVFSRRKVVVFGAFLALLIIVAGMFPNQIAPNDPYKMDLMKSLAGSSSEFPLGTDELGRCLFSRIIHGARFALLTGVLTVLVSSIIGTFLGLLAGFGGKVVEEVIMRFCDAWISIPQMFLIIIVSMIMGRGLWGIVIAVGVGGFEIEKSA